MKDLRLLQKKVTEKINTVAVVHETSSSFEKSTYAKTGHFYRHSLWCVGKELVETDLLIRSVIDRDFKCM